MNNLFLRTAFLLFLLVMVDVAPATASDIVFGQLSFSLDENHLTATVNGTTMLVPQGDLFIPESVEYDGKTYVVTSIGERAFENCSGFTGSLTIPNSVTSIGRSAFYGCSGLNGTLTIPNSVTSIGDQAFYICRGFNGGLIISESVTSIGASAFHGCSGFTGNLTIPNSVTSIGDGAFYNCRGFNGGLIIPESVTSIGDMVFYGCSGFTGSLTIGNSVTSIGNYAFYKCSGFTGSLTLPNSVSSIGESAFSGCSGFTGSLTIPESVTSIEYYAFSACTNLSGSVTLPSALKTIGTAPFSSCNFTEYISMNPTPPDPIFEYKEFILFTSDNVKLAKLYVPEESIELYNNAPGWSAMAPANAYIVKCTSISLSKTLSVTVGSSQKLTASLTPTETTEEITWKSSDESVATVDATGLVTANKVGTATITATCGTVSATCTVTVSPIVATSVTLNATTRSITIGGTSQLTATVNPDNTTNKTVTWKSSDEAVATVDATGLVAAKKAGTATITATCGTVSATCTVTVTPVVATSVTLNATTRSLTIGGTSQLTATVNPDNTTNKTVTWKSSDEKVATVAADGTVTAVGVGTVTIMATCGTVSATCTVTVNPVVATSVTLNATTRSITIGGTSQLTATVKPDNTTNKTVTWKSSDESVATVDATGLVTANKVGTATITATCGTVSTTCAVTVTPVVATSVTLNATTRSLTIGGTSQLTATVKPDDTTNKTVTWKSSDEAVATVDATGLVAAKKAGTATITATCGEVSATCTVTVKAVPATKIDLDKKSIPALHINHTTTLKATIAPTSTTDKTVTWTSSNPEVASVDNSGKITGLSFGETTITATTSNGLKATCKVTVIPWTVGGVAYERVPGGGPNGEDIVKIIGGKPDEDGTLTILGTVEIEEMEYYVTEIAPGAFKGNAEITKLVIPKTVVTIGNEAFAGCTNLTEVEAQDGTATLACGADAFNGAPIENLYLGRNTTGSPFANNAALTDLQIGRTVTALSSADFKGCTAIRDVTAYPTTPPALTDDGFEQEVYANATLHVGDAAEAAYKTAEGWKNFVVTQGLTEVLPESMTLNIAEVEMKEKSAMTLTVTFTPGETTNKRVTWRSSNTKVATVNANGRVTAIAVGTAVITATSVTTTADGETPTAKCTVTVVPQTGTAEGIGYEIVIGGGENGEDIVKVTGGEVDPDGTLTIPSEIEIDGVKYPVKEIAPGAFKDRSDIKKVIIPPTVETIGDEAFAGCTNLTEIVAEDGEEILACGTDAFKDAPVEKLYLGRDTSGLPFKDKDSLRSLTFGDKVTIIDPSDFEGCPAIKDITVLAPLPPELFEESFEESVYGSATLRVPDAAVPDYKAHEVWSKFATLIGESDILPIEVEMTLGSARLIEGESATLKATITPENATVTSLRWSSNEESVAKVNASGVVTAIKAGSATITATTANGLTATCTVKVIAKSGTSGNISYEIIPGGGEGEGESEGGGHIVITGGETDPDGKLIIPDEIEIDGVKYPVKEIAPGAFKDRTDIKEVVISKNVETVGDEAFSGCTNLKKVVEEDGEKPLTFGKDAFRDAPIEDLYHGRDHGGNPYAGNDKLTAVEIGDKVTTIGSGEYAGCKNITEVMVTNPVPPVLAEDAFEQEVFDNATLTVPDGSKDAYKAAEGWNKFGKVVEESEIPVVSVELNIAALTLVEGESQQLIATVTPDDATDASLLWTTSNAAVATVGANGIITAVKSGTATITVTTANGLTATCTVTVTAKPAQNPTQPEQPGEGDDDTAIDDVNGDSEGGVSIEGGSIVAPEGAAVYDLAGRIVAKTNLPKGIYIVRTPAGRTVKVRID